MEDIIAEHSSIKNYRNLDLIFDIEPVLIKIKNKILLLDDIVYEKGRTEGIIKRKEEGFWIFWYENGQKWSEGNYRNGKREGLWITWWSTGQKWTEGNYRNGEKEGLWVSWHRRGQKASEGNYRNGEEDGLWISWNYNGQKLEEIN